MLHAAWRGLIASLLASLLTRYHGVRLSKEVDVENLQQENLQQGDLQEERHERIPGGEDVDPNFMTYTFHPGDTGFAVNRFNGQVECVGFGGQAYNLGVQNGWWVHKVNSFYRYTEWRLGEYANGTGDYNIVFSDIQAEGHCQDLPYNWKDSKGRTCADYEAQSLCSTWGTQGTHWPTCSRWSLFCKNRDIHYYAARQTDALTACCSCGGGWDPEGPTTSLYPTSAPTSAPEVPTPGPTSAQPTPAPTEAPTAVPTPAEDDEPSPTPSTNSSDNETAPREPNLVWWGNWSDWRMISICAGGGSLLSIFLCCIWRSRPAPEEMSEALSTASMTPARTAESTS